MVGTPKAGHENAFSAQLLGCDIECAGGCCRPWQPLGKRILDANKLNMRVRCQEALDHVVGLFWFIRAHTVH